MIWQSLRYGCSQVLGNKRILIFYYLLNLLLAIILIIPIRKVLSDFANHSLMGQKLLVGFDINFFTEFFQKHGDAFGVWMLFLTFAAIFYWIMLLFLSGGVLHVFIHEVKGSLASVMENSARYFSRMIRLSLWSLPVLAVLLCFQFLYSGVQRLIFGNDPYQSVLYWGVWVKIAIRFLALWFFAVIFDYARIHLVRTGERKTRKSLIAAIRFVFSNLGKTVGLKTLLIVAGIVALIVLNLITHSLDSSAGIVIFISFIIGQIYMVFRAYLKLITFSSQAELHRNVAAEQQIKNSDEILLAV